MICLVTSTEYEAEALLTEVEIAETEKEGQFTLHLCKYKGNWFLLLLAGYGTLNMGLAIGYAISRYEVTTFIGFGDCASLDASIAPIDSLVILTTSMETDVDFEPLGYPEVVVPGMDRGSYTANPRLVSKLRVFLEKEKKEIRLGTIGSVQQFIVDEEMAQQMKERYHINYVDNESGPIGQAASSLGVPFVLLKGVSNYADGNAVSEYENCATRVNRACSQMIFGFLVTLLEE